ncbi:MAG TPA: hypothetical protein VMD98_14225 [Bryocella sp.]|nr:hypothetical protein [Bryocella sp.]
MCRYPNNGVGLGGSGGRGNGGRGGMGGVGEVVPAINGVGLGGSGGRGNGGRGGMGGVGEVVPAISTGKGGYGGSGGVGPGLGIGGVGGVGGRGGFITDGPAPTYETVVAKLLTTNRARSITTPASSLRVMACSLKHSALPSGSTGGLRWRPGCA